jgi:hypothetical protein
LPFAESSCGIQEAAEMTALMVKSFQLSAIVFGLGAKQDVCDNGEAKAGKKGFAPCIYRKRG